MTKPFLKWVGGKRQLLPEITKYVPTTFGTYYEPFAGGGALFFELEPKRAVLNDANPHLIGCYRAIRDFPDKVISLLSEMEPHQGSTAYYAVRQSFNDNVNEHGCFRQAARFIYINRIGFNGLWRVNSRGHCNVPIGRRSSPVVFDVDGIRAASLALRDVQLGHGRFFDFPPLQAPAAGDFVYFDPPYIPASATADFTSYTADGFGYADQIRLRDLAVTLARRGVHVIVSNSDTSATRALWDGAPGFTIHAIQARRAINCKAGKRGPVGELIISTRRST